MRNSPKGIHIGELVPDLYAALAAQQEQIEALKATVEELKQKLGV